MGCSISALTEKQVVNLCDGKILGHIVDFKVDICGGYITAIVLPGETSLFGFKKCTDIIIPWNKICKIGDDAIIVDIGPISNVEIGENKKKRWFLGC
ncbi:MAG: YlmC/YmxH family sporulation protein [Clostridia bacterium]|nr:YlmC/YmxH family sporulation protein [Clostridia bacterium]MBR2943527.1 YlmC/YmxH family sporulation protein [Clostridia bacterium]